jgi:hypothetical protein
MNTNLARPEEEVRSDEVVTNPIPHGTLVAMLALAEDGDVIGIPCLRKVSSDDSTDAIFECTTLYGCILLATPTRRIISRLYDAYEWIEGVAGTEVRENDTHITLIDEFGDAPSWHSEFNCTLFKGKRKDLPEDYFWSLSSEGSSH